MKRWLAIAETNPSGVPGRRVERRLFRWQWLAIVWGDWFLLFHEFGAVEIYTKKTDRDQITVCD